MYIKCNFIHSDISLQFFMENIAKRNNLFSIYDYFYFIFLKNKTGFFLYLTTLCANLYFIFDTLRFVLAFT